MRLARSCLEASAGLLLLLAFSGLNPGHGSLTVINFSANLVPGSCDFELDIPKLLLDPVRPAELIASRLIGAKKVELQISNCNVSTSLKPFISVSGKGQNLGKWAFRDDATSTAKNVGVMLVKSDAPPDYSHTALTNGGKVTLDTSGSVIPNQTLTFYAGLICGTTANCRAATLGEVNATIEFTLNHP
ncbi:type 1 fimbrial protein [Enterobacter sp. Ap-1006]|uniref:fimbrial protein n=1 Tax=Enterobacter sp. Ap-1006 TaxID=2608345 RepID=UPI001423DF37|nr:type 1 fimbrial protein [Enterobacter sp. Ap-1006]NIF47405.1 type 1 fimbrial protein [Enterobacter sp. Ap-1006]